MTTSERFRSEEDSRRRWRRVPVRLTMHCRRLGRGEQEMVVEAVDLSPGGVRLRAPDRLITGDVVLCWTDSGSEAAPVGLKGLVVQARAHRNETCDVHVAWTNLSPESGDLLNRLLTLHETQHPAASTDPV